MKTADYLDAPIVPWEDWAADDFIALELCPESNKARSSVDELPQSAMRVLLRELAFAEKIEVVSAENSERYFNISLKIGRTKLGSWDMYEFEYRPTWDWWPAFERRVVWDLSEESNDSDDDLVENCVTVSSWNDTMSCASSAHSSAERIIAAAQNRRQDGNFGAADALLFLVTAHPATPPNVRQVLQQDPDETIRAVAAQHAN